MSISAAIVVVDGPAPRTLEAAFASAVDQTSGAAELVVVDRFETPGLSREVLNSAVSAMPATTFITPTGPGPGHAYNAGVAATTAASIVVLDGDLLHPDFVKRTVSLLDDRPDLSFASCARLEIGREIRRWKPPPYTVASALGRDECGQLSSLFRRNMWERLGGFDASLELFPEVDFWLRALADGFHGAILDEPLVIRDDRDGIPVPPDPDRLMRAREALIARHVDLSSPRGEDIFIALLGAERNLRRGGHAAQRDREALDDELSHAWLDGEALRRQRDVAPTPVPPAGQPIAADIEQALTRRALERLMPARAARRPLTIGAGSVWAANPKPSHDQVVVTGALEHEPDPLAALERCRSHLRPGGHLIVTAAAHALGGSRLHGFTFAGLRHLMCQVVPPETVHIETFGNLTALLGNRDAAMPQPLASRPDTVDDPRHPVLVAAIGQLPVARWRAHRATHPRSPRPRPRRQTVARQAGVLVYGRITAMHPDSRRSWTSPREFESQMELVARRYTPVPLLELAAQVASRDVTPGAVAVSFDGGHVDLLEVAAPILARLRIPATLFVEPTRCSHPREHWQDALETILLGEEPVPEWLSLDRGPLLGLELPTRSRSDRLHTLDCLLRAASTLPAGRRAGVLAQIRSWAGIHGKLSDANRLLTLQEVAAFARSGGHDVGLLVPAGDVPATDRWNPRIDWLERARQRLEHRLGAPVRALAYDGGPVHPFAGDVAAAVGFAVGCTREGDGVTFDSDWMRLPRFAIADEGAEVFAARLERLTVSAP